MIQELTSNDVAHLSPCKKHQVFLDVFLPNGFTESGLYVEYDERLYATFGRVLKTHPSCVFVSAGDVVWFPPMCYDELLKIDGRMVYSANERVFEAVILNYDTGTSVPKLGTGEVVI
jgi:hypothetical protein